MTTTIKSVANTIKVVTCTNSECAFECIGDHPEVVELLASGFSPISVNTTPGFERWSMVFVGDPRNLIKITTDTESQRPSETVVSTEEIPEEPDLPKKPTRKTNKKTVD